MDLQVWACVRSTHPNLHNCYAVCASASSRNDGEICFKALNCCVFAPCNDKIESCKVQTFNSVKSGTKTPLLIPQKFFCESAKFFRNLSFLFAHFVNIAHKGTSNNRNRHDSTQGVNLFFALDSKP